MTEAPTDADFERLAHEGRFVEAAEKALADRATERAIELLGLAGEDARAVEVAFEAERPELAMRAALRAGDEGLLASTVGRLARDSGAARMALAVAASRGRDLVAARLAEAVGDMELAARHYLAAHALRDAGRVAETSGALREAGKRYEAALAADPSDSVAALSLARILARLGRFENAAAVLQGRPPGDPSIERAAASLLTACLASLGLDVAAGEALATLRAMDPDVPADLEAFLRAEHGGREAFARRSAEGDGALVLGRYRIERPLGAGATGRVLLAFDVFREREVALKLLHVPTSAEGRDALLRFEREASIARGLAHPNVVRVEAFHPELPAIVLEYLPGGTLEERLARAEQAGSLLLQADVQAIARDLLRALGYAHERGVVHRDVKPANVLFSATGEAKLGDFGTAHLEGAGITRTAALVGTLATMAPEQIAGGSTPTAATDLYAFGCVVFRMLVGRFPFVGRDVAGQHLSASPPLPSSLRPGIDPAWDAIVSALLAKEPTDRPASAIDVLERLRPIADREPAPMAVPSTKGIASESPRTPERFVPIRAVGEGRLVHDVLLDRDVRIVPASPDDRRRYRLFAAADDPALAAVFDVDDAGGRVVLEHPKGDPLSAPRAPVDPGTIAASLGPLLERLRACGLRHGAFDEEHVVVGPHRVVLLLPEHEADPSSDDARSFADLLGRLERRRRSRDGG